MAILELCGVRALPAAGDVSGASACFGCGVLGVPSTSSLGVQFGVEFGVFDAKGCVLGPELGSLGSEFGEFGVVVTVYPVQLTSVPSLSAEPQV